MYFKSISKQVLILQHFIYMFTRDLSFSDESHIIRPYFWMSFARGEKPDQSLPPERHARIEAASSIFITYLVWRGLELNSRPPANDKILALSSNINVKTTVCAFEVYKKTVMIGGTANCVQFVYECVKQNNPTCCSFNLRLLTSNRKITRVYLCLLPVNVWPCMLTGCSSALSENMYQATRSPAHTDRSGRLPYM